MSLHLRMGQQRQALNFENSSLRTMIRNIFIIFQEVRVAICLVKLKKERHTPRPTKAQNRQVNYEIAGQKWSE